MPLIHTMGGVVFFTDDQVRRRTELEASRCLSVAGACPKAKILCNGF